MQSFSESEINERMKMFILGIASIDDLVYQNDDEELMLLNNNIIIIDKLLGIYPDSIFTELKNNTIKMAKNCSIVSCLRRYVQHVTNYLITNVLPFKNNTQFIRLTHEQMITNVREILKCIDCIANETIINKFVTEYDWMDGYNYIIYVTNMHLQVH